MPAASPPALVQRRHTSFLLGAGLAVALRLVAADPAVVAEPLRDRAMAAATLFAPVPPTDSGVVVTNEYDDPRMWAGLYHEFEVGEIGTGVAIGDYDNDGWPDLFVVNKTGSCRLYRNLGNYRFVDVTEGAGVADTGAAAGIWKQGVAFADVNNDGWLDLYVCRFNAPNLLYINQGDGTFKEMAHAYGLDLVDASGMAAFCDYDRDGRLDVFVHTNLLDSTLHPAGQRGHLFHQERDGTFREVTEQAGLSGEQQSHSAIWWDFDQDGWPDLYVANDFSPRDQLWRNNRDGTFTDVIDQVVPHLPFSSMGADLGDVNNDGLVDLLVADMAATNHVRDQREMAAARSQAHDPPDDAREAPCVYHNALYLNTGTGRCVEAAFLAGVAATDWTWSVRFEDFDNDGWLDLFVTNGMHREVNNADLLRRQMVTESAAGRVGIMRRSPVLAERNLVFRNRGDLRFEEVGSAWGADQTGVSFGAAVGDLDRDGNLDVVYANYRGQVTILRNTEDRRHRLVVALRGTASNRFGIGATVAVETDSGRQLRPLVLARGYLSTSEPVVHFGLGADTRIRRLIVTWPSGRIQTLRDLAADQRLTITEPAGPLNNPPATVPNQPQFVEVGKSAGATWLSSEEPVDELSAQPLLPRRLNRAGPFLAVGDIDGGGRESLIVGGTSRTPLQVLRAVGADRFAPAEPLPGRPAGPVNDGPVLLFDAMGRGRGDLLVAKAGNSLGADSPEYQPELWISDGHGGFIAAPEGPLPRFPASVSVAVAADFTREGRLGVFLGGRLVPGAYPETPRSALWVNHGGRFEDITDSAAPALRHVGLVTAAQWSDVDADGWPDLLVATEWGPVRYFHNASGAAFEDWTERAGFASGGSGWWTSLASGDFNGDGRLDYVAGNVGTNTQYRADPVHPALLFEGQFAGPDEPPQLVEAYYESGRLYPWRNRLDVGAAIPDVLRRFPTNDAYATATIEQVLGGAALASARRLAATELRSGVFLSQPDGTFKFTPLPWMAQLAPLQGIVAVDCNGDGRTDIIAAQNSYAPAPVVGRFDGGLGIVLTGDGQGGFAAESPVRSGFIVPGDARALALLDLGADGWPDLVVSRNNDTGLVFRNRGTGGRRCVAVALRGSPGNPHAVGARLILTAPDGRTQTAEISTGCGLGQPAPLAFFGVPVGSAARLHIRWPDGTELDATVPASATRWTVELAR